MKINKKLTMAGAFARDTNGDYYIFYGEGVGETVHSAPNMALVKYSSAGKELDTFWLDAYPSDSFNGVKMPFAWANCKLEISGDMVAVYFGRRMFKSDDGLNHQSSCGFILDKNTFKRLTTSRTVTPYSSHSFDQFILAENGDFVFVDLGDAYPRAFRFSKVTDRAQARQQKDSFTFEGETGNNNTGASLGGLAKTSNGYIFAGVYGAISGSDRNLLVMTMDKNLNNISSPIWLTNFDGNKNTVVNPKIVQVGSNKYLLLWELVCKENGNTVGTFTYSALIDESGRLLTNPTQVDAPINAYDTLRYNGATQKAYWSAIIKDSSTASSQPTANLYAFDPQLANTVPARGVTLTRAAGTICTKYGQGVSPYEGFDKMKLVASVSPANTANKKLIWTSSNTQVATVDKDGIVQGGYTEGTVTITAKTVDGGYTASCQITVVKANQQALKQNNSSVVFQENRLYMGMPIIIRNDRIFYPFREILENMGATVSWDAVTRTAIGELNGNRVEFQYI